MSANISFADTKIAFSYKSDAALKKSYLLFAAVNYPLLSKLGTNIVKFGMKVKVPMKGIVKGTIFQQFCGGETIAECENTIDTLARHGVKTILDFAVEGGSGAFAYDAILEEIKKTIDRAQGDPHIPFSVFKPTALAPIDLLANLQLGLSPSDQEKEEFERVKKRFDTLAKKCFDSGVRLLVDSEDSWIQQPIDQMVYALMARYNRERAVVYNTYQFYRKGMLDALKNAYADAERQGYFLGVKLVRGAYMEKERERASAMGYEDPILPDKDATDDQYNDALDYCMQHIDRIAICSGSHNEKSNYLLAELMQQQNLSPEDERVYFAQLYGMSDNISFNLAHAGYNVVKYVPYGPVRAVLPYLFRRAEENTSIAGQSSRELALVKRELKRRKTEA
jgi:proline dehydrogenase